ncbi:MAG: ankyrin repeat domain-containing protein [Candidatus Omnitrophica bacterium]|nr:ankyrin repeat domain-containing protein [Candidatus Omnitrophota bacterium]
MTPLNNLVVASSLAVALLGLSQVWMIVAAFRTSVRWGFACLFLPFFQIFFLFLHWDRAAKPFLLGVCAVLLTAGSLLIYTQSGGPGQKEERMRSLKEIQAKFGDLEKTDLLREDWAQKAGQLFRDVGRSPAAQKMAAFFEAVTGSEKTSRSPLPYSRELGVESVRASRPARDLIMAVRTGELVEVERRLNAGDDVNTLSRVGQTPLMEAAAYGYEAIVRSLVEHGAKLDLTNPQGRTALEIARENDRGSIAALLEREQSLKAALETASVEP